ncbi:UDP-N-acetylmuramoylalanyl-D-glutamate--2,6-diaminopimelate ligase [Alkalithermobacter thermoalcaliphilus JW-YL-7 = DSM 7308]|uniref:UDP-N-acetylmuramoyl-L-alanyl-D-glutamate--2,6-diaminopimelate ligase n=1 Tax=Alkalithermobacter thermoalcaliphilus JW-YL-7 = DSM 7308 TaxID=1121328 RepID=A0A150FQR6_CLOPD|nr:UDP-N-acetylmuramoyl-L-alanyl-D-glutamate--2,6-diaminopimelate ligase [[Clostridium] paradoxum JW-YL-7 = DSM 7308]SHK98667.1 UDP-N-acetylmuramoylalanyl-D-glutamate--2,6-diaminopimelate ligase [[Clostridium] paradoxum JW-YL-7 = DSM 7308]
MKLKDIISGLDIIDIHGKLDLEINSIDYDSRRLDKDSLFICIKGFNVDGHNFIQEGIKKGSRAFIVQDDIFIEGYTFIRVKDTRDAMAIIASNFYKNPTKDLNLVGVTGTNGKTTITYLLKDILHEEGVGLIGTIKNIIGDKEIVSSRTTPESLQLQSYFREMVDKNVKYCVMEVSSHSLELKRVEECEFKVGIFTNLTEDHLDFHKTLENYRLAKQKLFYKTTKANIINIDDEGGRKIYEDIKHLKTPIITYGINNKADITAKDIKMFLDKVQYTVVTDEFEEEVEVPIPGKFTVYNSLAVIGACIALGIPKEIIIKRLKKANKVPGRFETINSSKNFSVIVDYAHTPDALENIIKTAREFVRGNIITVFGCGGDRDRSKRPIMGKISQDLSDISIITSDNPRSEDPKKIVEDILEGMNKNINNYKIIIDRKEAIKQAIAMANEGDIVIVAGKGHEDYQIIGDKKIHFDDKEVVREFLKEDKK